MRRFALDPFDNHFSRPRRPRWLPRAEAIDVTGDLIQRAIAGTTSGAGSVGGRMTTATIADPSIRYGGAPATKRGRDRDQRQENGVGQFARQCAYDPDQ